MKPLPNEQWTKEMKEKINHLLVISHSQKDKLSLVVWQYLDLLYTDAENTESRLLFTNRFIQLYKRHLHHRIEGNTAINAAPEQAEKVEEETQELQQTAEVAINVVAPSNSQLTDVPVAALKRPAEPSGTGTKQDTMQLSQQLLQALRHFNREGSFANPKSESKPATKRKQISTNPNSGTMKACNCLYCGQHKSKMSGQRNTHIKKGGPRYFFCPAKVHLTSSTSLPTGRRSLTRRDSRRRRKEKKEVGDGGGGVEEPWQHERVYVLNIYLIFKHSFLAFATFFKNKDKTTKTDKIWVQIISTKR